MEFVRSKKPALSLDMAPLIDVVFQLLIFFMLSSSFLSVAPAIHLDLPKAVSGDPIEEHRVVVSVDKEGKVFINGETTSLDLLEARLERVLAGESKRQVFIRGDKEMPYKYFVEIMDTARRAGAHHVNVVHELNVAPS